MDPVRQLAQLGIGLLRVGKGFGNQRLGGPVALPMRPLGQLQRHDGVHQALLGAVVEIAHDAAPGAVAGVEDTSP